MPIIPVPAITPIAGTSVTIQNPVKGANSPAPAILLVQNISPYELQFTSINNQPDAMIPPFMADLVSYDISEVEQITLLPINLGFLPVTGIPPQVLCFWYLAGSPLPSSSYPSAIVPYGNLESVSIVGLVDVDPLVDAITLGIYDNAYPGTTITSTGDFDLGLALPSGLHITGWKTVAAGGEGSGVLAIPGQFFFGGFSTQSGVASGTYPGGGIPTVGGELFAYCFSANSDFNVMAEVTGFIP